MMRRNKWIFTWLQMIYSIHGHATVNFGLMFETWNLVSSGASKTSSGAQRASEQAHWITAERMSEWPPLFFPHSLNYSCFKKARLQIPVSVLDLPSSRMSNRKDCPSTTTSFLNRPPSGDSSCMYDPVKYLRIRWGQSNDLRWPSVAIFFFANLNIEFYS